MVDNTRNLTLVDTVNVSQTLLRHAPGSLANRFHVIPGELVKIVSFGANRIGATFPSRVPVIIASGSEPKVSRIDATPVCNIASRIKAITVVQHALTFRDRSKAKNPTESGSQNTTFISCAFGELGAAVAGFAASPKPAAVRTGKLVHPGPEAIFNRGAEAVPFQKVRRQFPFCNHRKSFGGLGFVYRQPGPLTPKNGKRRTPKSPSQLTIKMEK